MNDVRCHCPGLSGQRNGCKYAPSSGDSVQFCHKGQDGEYINEIGNPLV